jgi:hypothetical protein
MADSQPVHPIDWQIFLAFVKRLHGAWIEEADLTIELDQHMSAKYAMKGQKAEIHPSVGTGGYYLVALRLP